MDEMRNDLELTDILEEDSLMHYGVGVDDGAPGRGSGRYPKGSGENPYQRYGDFYSRYKACEAKGMSKKEIAEELGVLDKFGNPAVGKLALKYSLATNEQKAAKRAQVMRLHEQGLSNTEIGKLMDINESSVRTMLKEGNGIKMSVAQKTADTLKDFVDKNRYVDIDSGTEIAFGVNEGRLKTAVGILEEEGYRVETVHMDRLGTKHKMQVKCLVPPDCTYQELSEHRFDIINPLDSSKQIDINGEISRLGVEHPVSVDRSRIQVLYDEDGGTNRDGLIEVRRGVEDLSLGRGNYAQVRIAVDDSKYLKGMALYSDDLPPGIDIRVWSNKSNANPEKAFKKMKKLKENGVETDQIDWDNPFGASIDQKRYIGSDGKEHLSPINIVTKHEEGDWEDWGRTLASQFLSKQPVALAARQLDVAYKDRKQEFDEICALTNPSVKKKLLIDFGDNCDANAVELKAAPFAGQQTAVILPFTELKDNEIYAPKYKDGQRVALVRYPHGGIFEIPELTVHNTGSPVKDILGNAPDAVGINRNVAEVLSGADFDGDTVTVIPLSDKVRIRSRKPLPELEGFDHKTEYASYPGMKVIGSQEKQNEMGKITNLITDMTLKGAPDSEVAAAVKHSMVIIDAEKHELDYKRSYNENDISTLKHRWQDDGSGHTGAGTIISRAKSPEHVPQRKEWTPSAASIDPETGKKIFKETGEVYYTGTLKNKPVADLKTASDGRTYFTVGRKRVYGTKEDLDAYNKQFDGIKINSDGSIHLQKDYKNGGYYYLKMDRDTGKKIRVPVSEDAFVGGVKTKPRTQESTRMANTDDAFKLTSGGSKENYGYPIEKVYATFANQMKGLGNEARKEWLNTKTDKKDPEAAKKYANEVKSLNDQLELAKANAPMERRAQRIANQTMAIKKMDNPEMSKEELKRYRQQAIDSARDKLGYKKYKINITDKEWEAIQAHAISPSKLDKIMEYVDTDRLRQLATPRSTRTITPSMKSLAKSMEASGYTAKQIADRLGISTTSVYNAIHGKTEGGD